MYVLLDVLTFISIIHDISEFVGRLKLYFLFFSRTYGQTAFVQHGRGFRLETIYYTFSFPFLFPTVRPHACCWQGNRK